MDLENSDDNELELPTSLPSPEEEMAEEFDGGTELTEKERPLNSGHRPPRQLWLISYSDFMTILMIFFLAMYGYTYLAKATLLTMQKKQINYTEFTDQIVQLQKALGGQLKVQNDVDKVVIQMEEKILFASGSASLSKSARPTLEELAKSIMLVEGDVIVEGHTDNVPVRSGRFKSNWELSAARAFSVINELTEQGVPPERLAAWGFGENRPLVPNTTVENRAQNRRIEAVILKKKQKKKES